MYFPVNQDFLRSIEGKAFSREFGMRGRGILLTLLDEFANTETGYFRIERLPLLIAEHDEDQAYVMRVIESLIRYQLVHYEAKDPSIYNRQITESKKALEEKKRVLKENNKLGKKRDISPTLDPTSIVVVVESLLKSDPNKKLYLDAVLLTDDEFATVEKRYAKDGLAKRDVQRGIELLNKWFLDNKKMRSERTHDHRALVGWPLAAVLEEQVTQQKLQNQQGIAQKFGGTGPSPPSNKQPPRGFEVAECSK